MASLIRQVADNISPTVASLVIEAAMDPDDADASVDGPSNLVA